MATNANSAFLASLKAPTKPVGAIDFEKGEPDAALLAAWNHRQLLVNEIERVCRFYDADDHCPGKLAAFDLLENSIPKMPAMSVKGLLAKLWIALDHRGPVIRTDEARVESDAIRRADFGEVEAFAERLDFDQQIIFGAIRDLRYWLQFEVVALPTRRAA